jgi:molybdopterin guanine dinucleotide-containing S/N-oxide reductase-like protein
VTDAINQEKSFIRSLGLGGFDSGGNETVVDVKDGKIVRIRPLHFDWKYDKSGLNPWKFQRNGKTLEPVMKSLPPPFSLAYKKRAYSPNRIKYPLKRVDWDPNGERNPQNRGISKYKRISWDEAINLVASEIKRVQKEYGLLSILLQADGHGECKIIHAAHGCSTLLLDKMGGFTQQVRNPDSWEGWYWGTSHVWGMGFVGMMTPMDNLVKDVSDYSEQLLFWGCDPETTPWGFAGQSFSRLSYFWSEAGIKQIYICPDLNYGAAIHADKWIPILPNTDAAMQLAIAYTWVTEGIYDKEYVATHTVGFDKVLDYVMGRDDSIPKTPEWASPKCGVPEWTIKALAREFAVKITSIAHIYGGSYIRGPYSTEPARLEAILLGMQGLGKPGVHQFMMTLGVPRSYIVGGPGTIDLGQRLTQPMITTALAWGKQLIPKTLIQDAILNPPLTFMGSGGHMSPVEDQFKKYTYPISKEEGGAEIHMIWTDTPCRTTCWNDGNKNIEAMRSPKIEFILVQHPWLENDCLMGDLILPANTTFEVEDIMTNRRGGVQFETIALQKKAIEPIGESKSDFEIVCEIARKLGLYDQVTGGKTNEEWEKSVFYAYNTQKLISWEAFKEKEYYVFPNAVDWEKDTPGLRKFHDDPKNNPLTTPSGKLEFYSERLAKNFPDDKERPPVPHWIEKGETHDERISSERTKKYPLLLMSNHGRWRMHAQCDDISWTREALTCKVKGPDGYLYEPLWINTETAAKRGIKSGDIVKAHNERGAVLGGAYVSERLMPGVVYMDHGARVDWIIPGILDRGGAINLISPLGSISKNCIGEATSGYLVEVEKVTIAQMDQWKQQYPEAFEREYDPASGLQFNAWVE